MMQLFSDWITEIILFILLGTIFELLLPDHQMKKYLNLILGLLLLFILSKPILYLYSVDVSSVIKPFQDVIEMDEASSFQTENDILKQKKEIESAQDAYIWKEVAAQLRQKANEQLPEKYGQELLDVEIEHNDDREITVVYGAVKQVKETNTSKHNPIDDVEIETDRPLKDKQSDTKDEQLTAYLAKLWELDEDIIYIERKGEHID